MKKWFKKIIDKKTKDDDQDTDKEKNENITALYEIVEDHLKSLDFEQLRNISSEFAQRFRSHQEMISQIMRTPPPRMERRHGESDRQMPPEEFEIIDARTEGTAGPQFTTAVGTYSDEMILTHYDRMIRTQYDRLIDLTVKFLKEITESEIKRLESETKQVISEVRQLRDAVETEVGKLHDEIEQSEQRQQSLVHTLESELIGQGRKIAVINSRIRIVAAAVGIAAILGTAALILSLIR
jgi:hypothetical protein